MELVEISEGSPAAKSFGSSIAKEFIKAAHVTRANRHEQALAAPVAKWVSESTSHAIAGIFGSNWQPKPDAAKAQADALLAEHFNVDRWTEELAKIVGKPTANAFVEGAVAERRLAAAAIRRRGKATAAEFADDVTGEVWFDVDIPEWIMSAARAFLDAAFNQPYWLEVAQTTLDDMATALGNFIETGKSIPQIRDLLIEQFGAAYSKVRATLIARTEIGGALNAGAIASIKHTYEGTDLEPTKVWQSVFSATTRPEHADADGQEVSVDSDFTVGGEQCDHPGDVRLSAGMRCNCLCFVTSGLVGAELSSEDRQRIEDATRGYNPDQPRDPAGTGTGGQWTSTGHSSEAVGGFELGKYPHPDALTEAVAKERYKHLVEQDAVHLKAIHDNRAKAKAEPDWRKKQEHFAAARKANAMREMVQYDAMTYRQAADAADKAGYLEGRAAQAVIRKAQFETKEAMTKEMVDAGVRPTSNESYREELQAQSVASEGVYQDTPEQKMAAVQKAFSGVTKEMYDKARKSTEGSYEFDIKEDLAKAAYYGEPKAVGSLNKTLGIVHTDLMPPAVVRGQGSAPQTAKQFFADAEIAINLKDTPMDRLISNGEFKNRFEGGVQGVNSAKGAQYKEARRRSEEKNFGIAESAEGSSRPAYGYLEHPDRLGSTGARIGSNYGTNQIVLREGVKERATFTIGDSIDDARIRKGAGVSPVNDPHIPAAISEEDHVYTPAANSRDWNVRMPEMQFGGYTGGAFQDVAPQYIEAQVFGKVKLEDIKELRIPRTRVLKPAQEKKLKAAGIKVVRVAPAMKTRFYATPPADWDKAFTEED